MHRIGGKSMALNSLQDLFSEQIADLYNAETQLVDALPKMSEAAASQELRQAFDQHLAQTRQHVQRLEQIYEQTGVERMNKECKGMKGLIAEGQEVIKERGNDVTKDAALIAAAQRVEHYEIAGYGTVRTYAERLGFEEAISLLEQTLEEESKTDEMLTSLATDGINAAAARR